MSVATRSERPTASPETVLSTRARCTGSAASEKATRDSCWLVSVATKEENCSGSSWPAVSAVKATASSSATAALARANAATARRLSDRLSSPGSWASPSP
ncbi:hypothetical protein B0E54_02338 [Micromonospora sp. MH99]|nr:hypothetical protein [Micromonospora sp. MH99]